MNITLNAEMEKFIQERLNSGKYSTVDEVFLEAFRLLNERDKQYQTWIEETRTKVEIAIEQIDRGEGIDGDVVMARMRDKIRNAYN